MPTRTEHVRQTTVPKEGSVYTTREVHDDGHEVAHTQNVLTRIVWFFAGALLILLSFRFVLALLGANPLNAFADFIFTVSQPFVSPFFSLFSYRIEEGVSRVELYTLVAMAVYAVAAYGLVKLINLNRP